MLALKKYKLKGKIWLQQEQLQIYVYIYIHKLKN